MGVGLHHAGILPSVKRLIEVLFERGLCKVVFATETMSLGIHMPARASSLQSLTKRTDRGFRSSDAQRADADGRARGAPRHRSRGQVRDGARRCATGSTTCAASSTARPSRSRASSSSATGRSRSSCRPARTWRRIRRTVESSFGQYQNLKRIRGLEADVRSLEVALEDARALPRAVRRLLAHRPLSHGARRTSRPRAWPRGRGGRRGESHGARPSRGGSSWCGARAAPTLGDRRSGTRSGGDTARCSTRPPAPRRHRADEGAA